MNLAKNLVVWPVERLRPYERNARTHSDEQVNQIAASITEFGFTNPVLVDSNDGIIAGHGRLLAAKRLGLKEVPVIVLDHLSNEQRRAYIIADNKLALNAGWDADLLQEELKDLEADDFDLEAIGFTEDELEAILETEQPESIIESRPAPVLREEIKERAREIKVEEKQAAREEARASTEEIYTKKVQAPIYQPSGEKPEISSLVDESATKALIQAIKDSDVSQEEKAFLLLAAHRHLKFDYVHIAEFYAHASPKTQRLMEDSALVIIDFDRAIELGFVEMTKNIADAYRSDEAR